jgi:GNAT superfamily N-acetyltransferase
VGEEKIEIARAALEALDVQALIAALNEELEDRYPEEGANHFRLDAEEVAPGRGCLLVARIGRMAVACGAVRLNDPETAEIKRMYTLPSVRGRGLARRLLDALEVEARALGARRWFRNRADRGSAQPGRRASGRPPVRRVPRFAAVDLHGKTADLTR